MRGESVQDSEARVEPTEEPEETCVIVEEREEKTPSHMRGEDR
jgi:hypothetical protein